MAAQSMQVAKDVFGHRASHAVRFESHEATHAGSGSGVVGAAKHAVATLAPEAPHSALLSATHFTAAPAPVAWQAAGQ